MSAKLGTADAAFRLGAVTPAAVYLGATQVWSAVTVPGAPTITSAFFLFGSTTYIAYSGPENDGGSEITAYRFYFDGVLTEPDSGVSGVEAFFNTDYTGQTVEVSAVNAVGEGPKSAPATVATP